MGRRGRPDLKIPMRAFFSLQEWLTLYFLFKSGGMLNVTLVWDTQLVISELEKMYTLSHLLVPLSPFYALLNTVLLLKMGNWYKYWKAFTCLPCLPRLCPSLSPHCLPPSWCYQNKLYLRYSVQVNRWGVTVVPVSLSWLLRLIRRFICCKNVWMK